MQELNKGLFDYLIANAAACPNACTSFKVRSCPSRFVQEFNKGLFDYLIATDDVHGTAADDAAGGGGGKQRRKGGGGKDKGSKRKKDEEFGVTRGIDFKVGMQGKGLQGQAG